MPRLLTLAAVVLFASACGDDAAPTSPRPRTPDARVVDDVADSRGASGSSGSSTSPDATPDLGRADTASPRDSRADTLRADSAATDSAPAVEAAVDTRKPDDPGPWPDAGTRELFATSCSKMMFDTGLIQYCVWRMASDGVLRCMPAHVKAVYDSSSCKHIVGVIVESPGTINDVSTEYWTYDPDLEWANVDCLGSIEAHYPLRYYTVTDTNSKRHGVRITSYKAVAQYYPDYLYSVFRGSCAPELSPYYSVELVPDDFWLTMPTDAGAVDAGVSDTASGD